MVWGMDWNDLKYFLAVTRMGSLTDAAKHLQVSQATVARRIAALEDALGLTLFNKKTDGYYLTENARSLLDGAEQAEAYMRWIERGGENGSAAGVIRMAIPELLGNYFIIPQLRYFIKAHPKIRFEIVADVRSSRLSKGDADIVVRLSQPQYGDYTMKKVGAVTLGLFASSRYVNEYGVATDAKPHQYIGWESELGYLPMAKWLDNHFGAHSPVIQAHTMGSQLSASLSDIGISLLPLFVGQKHGLIQVHENVLKLDIWLLLRKGSHELLRVRLLATSIEEMFHDSRNLLTGLTS